MVGIEATGLPGAANMLGRGLCGPRAERSTATGIPVINIRDSGDCVLLFDESRLAFGEFEVEAPVRSGLAHAIYIHPTVETPIQHRRFWVERVGARPPEEIHCSTVPSHRKKVGVAAKTLAR